jgi:hypothetical protein
MLASGTSTVNKRRFARRGSRWRRTRRVLTVMRDSACSQARLVNLLQKIYCRPMFRVLAMMRDSGLPSGLMVSLLHKSISTLPADVGILAGP